MNRAAKLLTVLQDGRPHSREDIQSRVGYFLTNNAASELRDRGFDVVAWQEWRNGRRVYWYQLAGRLNGVADRPAAPLSVSASDTAAGQAASASHPSSPEREPAGTLVLFDVEAVA